MAEINYSIVCDDVRFEKGKKLSFMGIYGSRILVPKFPFTFARLAFVQNIGELKTPDTFTVVMKGEGIRTITVKGKINKDEATREPTPKDLANIVLNFNSITFPRPGLLIFETSLQKAKLNACHEIDVGLADPGDLV